MPYLGIAIGLAALAFCLYQAFSNLRKARSIEDTPTAKVRSAPQGYIELTGFARSTGEGGLLAPLTSTPCVWYRYRVEQYVSNSRRSGGNWKTIRKGRSERHFQLEDNTGHCLIQPVRAEISSTRQRWHGSTPHPTSGPGTGGGLLTQLVGSRYRYTEERIHDGDWIYTAGFFQSVNPPSADEQAETRMKTLLNEWKQDHAGLLARFDSDGDGQVDLQEWERARQQAAQDAYREVLTDFDHSPLHFMTQSPNRSQPYLISSRDPGLLAKKYRQQAAIYGSLLALAALVAATGTYRYLL
jgi:hypothetical protein